MRPLDPRVLPHLLPARAPLAVVLVGNVLSGLLVVGQAFAGAALVATLLADPSGSGWHAPAWWFAGVTVGRGVAAWLVDVAAGRAAGRVGRHLRRLVLRATLDLEATDLSARRTGELATLATRGVAAVEPYLTRYLPALVLAVVLPVLTLAAMVSQDAWSALIVLLTLPLVPVFAILIGLTTQEKADRQWRALSTLAGHFLDVVRGLPTLVVHRRAHAQAPTIRAVTERYRRASADTLRLAFASSAALELIATISVALVAVSVGLRLAGGGIGLQTALTVLLLAPEAYWPLRRVGAEYHSAAEGTATFEAIHTLVESAAVDAHDRPVGTASPLGTPSRQALTAGDVESALVDAPAPLPIRIDDLTLTWPGRDRPALSGISAQIPAGGVTAVVGPSGSGKSTLLQALLGELAPSRGIVRVGGDELTAIRDHWRTQVAQLPQRPWLSADTIAANLRVGTPHATDADLESALALVDLADAVSALPHGIDTPLGEDGLGLSAGQRARLALARVVVARRPYVVLDEPTAHLDAHTEEVMLEVLRRLGETSTVIVVAHRTAVIDSADRIIELPARGPARPPHASTSADSTGAAVNERRLDRSSGEAAPTRPGPRSTRDDSAVAGVNERRLGTAGRWVLAGLLGTFAAASGVALTATAGWLIARSAEQPPILMLTVAIVGVRTFGLARPAFGYVERLISHDLALRTLATRRAAIYDRLVPLVPARLGRHGDVLTGVVDDVDAHLDDRLRVRLPLVTWVGVSALAGLCAWWVLPRSAPVVLVVALGGGALSFLAGWIAGRARESRFVAARGEVSRLTTDVVGSARQLVLWQADERALDDVDRAGTRLARAGDGSTAGTATGRAVALVAAGLGTVAVAVLGAPALADGLVSGPMLALLLLLPLALGDVTAPLADAGALRVRTAAAEARVRDLTGTAPAVSDPATPARLSPAPHEVSLVDAATGWASDRTAVSGVSMALPPGTRLGITGPSGSGKSTLATLLLKLLPLHAGDQRINGTLVPDLAGDDVRRVVGLVDDDPYLFGSTLVENVRLADPAATDPEVELALRGAHLGDWLDALPEGLHTRIGDGGSAVSGGERARIGLARALLAGRDVLVLDEPTAHLDSATARAVADDLLDAAGERTLVWITHDTVGLDRMDEVLRLGAAQISPPPVPQTH